MPDKRFSGVPVITAKGKLVGMITEADCMHGVEIGTAKKQSFWRSLFLTPKDAPKIIFGNMAARFPTDVSEIIHLMEKHQVKRVPVVKSGKVVGIVSRANIVQAVASVLRETVEGKDSDAEIRDKVLDALAELPWPAKTFVTVTVKNGVVDLWKAFTAFRQDESAVARSGKRS
jgi:CBS domain-containing protein